MEQARTELQRTFGDETDDYIAAFKEAYPQRAQSGTMPQDLLSIDWLFRPKTIITADAIGGKRKADTYMYMFTVVDDHNVSAHGAELKYCFDVLHHYSNQLSQQTIDATQKWADEMSSVWAQFAHTGNPNIYGAGTWHPYTKENGELMEFGGTVARIHHNHDRKLEEIIDRHCFKQLDEFRAKQKK